MKRGAVNAAFLIVKSAMRRKQIDSDFLVECAAQAE
jgi:hypothetical protein